MLFYLTDLQNNSTKREVTQIYYIRHVMQPVPRCLRRVGCAILCVHFVLYFNDK